MMTEVDRRERERKRDVEKKQRSKSQSGRGKNIKKQNLKFEVGELIKVSHWRRRRTGKMTGQVFCPSCSIKFHQCHSLKFS
jgi:hypothetical protein